MSYEDGATLFWADDDLRTPGVLRIRKCEFLRYHGNDRARVITEETEFIVPLNKLFVHVSNEGDIPVTEVPK